MGAAGSIMSGAAALMGGNSSSDGSTSSTVNSGNLAYPALSTALSPAVGNVSQGSSYLASLLGIPAAPTPTPAPAPTPAPTGGGRGNGKLGLAGSKNGGGVVRPAIQAAPNPVMPTPATTPAAAPMSQTSALQNFSDSAGMKFLEDNGNRMINNNAAAKGLVGSGATLKGLDDYSQGLHSQYLNQYLNNVLQYANLGNQAAGTLSDAGKYMNSTSRGTTSSSSKQGLGI
jgi:hypothetical protein